MVGIRNKQRETFGVLFDAIQKCESEADLERVADIIDEHLMTKGITKKQYRALEELQDDRLMDLVEQGEI